MKGRLGPVRGELEHVHDLLTHFLGAHPALLSQMPLLKDETIQCAFPNHDGCLDDPDMAIG